MWPLEEIDECEESVADADIAGNRTTLQPAHHMTNFVPAGRVSVLLAFSGGSGVLWANAAAHGDPEPDYRSKSCNRLTN
jgi:hypothetical protein